MHDGSSALYRAAFPAGFRPLVDRLIERDFGSGAVDSGDESAVLFRGPFPLRPPAYFQSMALVLDRTPAGTLEAAYRAFALGAAAGEIERACSSHAYAGRAPRRFALRGFRFGEPSSVGKDARAALERTIERITGLKPDSERPDLELQVSLREDGRAQLLASSGTALKDDREKGALPRSTARLLCELSRPTAEDVFLDPFMGSASLPMERSRMGPYKMIFAGDIDEERVASFKEALKAEAHRSKSFERKRRTIFPKTIDARDLSRFDPSFFSVIVTDPPWGLFEKIENRELLALYIDFLREAFRATADSGRLVILLGREAPLEDAIAASGCAWRIAEDYRVLVSGRKARASLLLKS